MKQNKYKYILVGDLHTKNSNIEETCQIFSFLNDISKDYNINNIFLMGDLFDTHGIVHLPVTYCYYDLFSKYEHLNFYCLVGNHDYVVHGSNSKHSLLPFKKLKNVTVIDDFFHFSDLNCSFDCIPHTSDDVFFELIKNKKADTLLCHHTFKGAVYENNFFAPDGIEISNVDYKNIVSGHIHKKQTIGKVFYIGTPRWLKESDANEDKGIYLWDGNSQYEYIKTEDVCRKICVLNIDTNSDLNISLNSKHRYIFNVNGDLSFVEKIAKMFDGTVEIRQVPNSYKEVFVKESDGVLNSLEDFVKNKYKPITGIENNLLWNEICKRIKL